MKRTTITNNENDNDNVNENENENENMKHYAYKRLSLALLLTLFSGMLWAQIPEGYYDSAEGKTGQELRLALHDIIKNHRSVGYSSLGDYYGYTDLDENQRIIDIYSNQHYTLDQAGGSSASEGNGWNKEHTWPQSWFGSGTPKSDIFHVYPTDAKVNNMRSNHPYAEVKNVTFTSSNGSKLGTSKTPGYSGKAFEPADEYKGDIARTYFYMSTRYYTEDASWKTSAMTNKCEIETWAMAMLLQWNDQDPVSQKEIDRNNAVYNFVQYNRNPFIDHPEYAHMIWDNASSEDYYDITIATSLEHGSITAPAKAAKGSTVTIIAKPEAGYTVDTWSAWKTGSPATTVSVSEKGTFTMPDYDVTVSATFKEGVGAGDFVKVTSTLDDWSGTYLIVYEDEDKEGIGMAFDGSLKDKLDVAYNTKAVTITDGTIAANDDTRAATFTVEPVMDADGYVIRSASGRFIGLASSTSNGMDESTDVPYINTISFDGSDLCIVGTGGAHLRYNKADKQERFRYYKASTYTAQKPVHLYRLNESAAPATVTITYHNGTATYTQQVNKGQAADLTPCTFTNPGYVFYGWTTKADGEGEYFENGATVTLQADLDLYAQWDKLYTVTLEQEGPGTVDITPTEAVEGAIVTVTATPADGFLLNSITVTDEKGNTTRLDDDEFEMPACNVTVKVVFTSPSTGIIDNNRETTANNRCYDLQGRSLTPHTSRRLRVGASAGILSPLKKGVYIRDGKKIIIK